MIILHTNFGDIRIELNSSKAPISSKNFKAYAKSGFYNGTIFHRVIKNFMIQGGGFEVGMKQKTTNDPIQNEADNGLSNLRGSIAMARTMEPHSATAQFFINLEDNTFLDHSSKSTEGWGYAVFGKVVEGMEVVDKIKAVNTTVKSGHQDVPADDVIIESVELVDDF
ncbi:MAG: peptidyl-prolyl cis-trans isomerase [Pseudomonadales bacterium]|nr:peptidyl-prolyl cis-trans isomerase [Pseudomonadales bacterium]MCP5215083.1 peptidyl-prolyl cis-trans isomerase [Pseudomonadales bacterium]